MMGQSLHEVSESVHICGSLLGQWCCIWHITCMWMFMVDRMVHDVSNRHTCRSFGWVGRYMMLCVTQYLPVEVVETSSRHTADSSNILLLPGIWKEITLTTWTRQYDHIGIIMTLLFLHSIIYHVVDTPLLFIWCNMYTDVFIPSYFPPFGHSAEIKWFTLPSLWCSSVGTLVLMSQDKYIHRYWLTLIIHYYPQSTSSNAEVFTPYIHMSMCLVVSWTSSTSLTLVVALKDSQKSPQRPIVCWNPDHIFRYL